MVIASRVGAGEVWSGVGTLGSPLVGERSTSRATQGSYTGRFFETRWSPEAVILSAAKDLRLARREILRCAQDDISHLAGSFPKKPTRVRTQGSPPLRDWIRLKTLHTGMHKKPTPER